MVNHETCKILKLEWKTGNEKFQTEYVSTDSSFWATEIGSCGQNTAQYEIWVFAPVNITTALSSAVRDKTDICRDPCLMG